MNASTLLPPAASVVADSEARIAPITAIPSAPPTWRNVFNMPEPTPDLSTGTELSAAAVIGVIVLAMPTPPRIMAGSNNQ